MAGGAKFDDSDMITDINVTPLVDIMLVLLIIFMLTAKLIMAPSIPVDLPKATTGESTEASTLTLTLSKEGSVYLNGKVATEAEVRALVAEEVKKKADTQVIIGADKTLAHGLVIHYIDLIRQAGVSKFALNIEPEAAK